MKKPNPKKWHSGPPPHIGWWNASCSRDVNKWRWWDGKTWSWCVEFWLDKYNAAEFAKKKTLIYDNRILWRHHYPKNPRVPRINPGNQK